VCAVLWLHVTCYMHVMTSYIAQHTQLVVLVLQLSYRHMGSYGAAGFGGEGCSSV
jgi:hypothetical protein